MYVFDYCMLKLGTYVFKSCILSIDAAVSSYRDYSREGVPGAKVANTDIYEIKYKGRECICEHHDI